MALSTQFTAPIVIVPAVAYRARDFAVLASVATLFFGLNVDFLVRGDASMYADYVLLGKFDELSLHIGYYALLFAADRTFGVVFGVPIHEMMVWINVAAGALAVGMSYLLGLHFLGSRRDAILCAILLALCGRVIMNATTAEIYMVQVLLLLTSFWLFAEDKVAGAGIVAALALLVSPLSAFSFLYFPVLDYQRAGRVRMSVHIRLAAAAAVVYLPYLALLGHELLWGRRGLIVINDAHDLYPVTAAVNFATFQFKHYTFLLLLAAPAVLAVRRNPRFLALTIAVAIPHIYIILKLPSEDNVFILLTDFFFACWLVLGWRELGRNQMTALIGPACVAGHVALLAISGSLFHFNSNRDYAAEMRNFARTHIIGKDAIAIADWDVGISLTFFGRESVNSTIEQDPLFEQMYDIGRVDAMDPLMLNAGELYVLESWAPGPLRRLLSSTAAIEELRKSRGTVATAAEVLNLECMFVSDGTHPVHRCVRRDGRTSEQSGSR